MNNERYRGGNNMIGEYVDELLDFNDGELDVLDALDTEVMINAQQVFDEIIADNDFDSLDDDYY